MPKTALTVNGRDVTIDADMMLLHALRDLLGLRATRIGCGAEGCGACTVIVDGAARFSCTLPVVGVAGATVQTADGLMSGPGAHPLVAAFQEHQAAQCGYCIPGILMRAKAHVDAGGDIDRASLALALDAHICRCGTHTRILAAVVAAARAMRSGRDRP